MAGCTFRPDAFAGVACANFIEAFRPTTETRILDVGGTDTNWRLVETDADITFLNLVVPEDQSDLPSNMRYVQGDGTALEYEDGSFDICFSNSTIEHVHTWEKQQAFAAEMRRVGSAIWMQTPAREFFFEPHWLTPFIHWLPKRWQRRLGRNFTLYGLAFRPPRAQVDELVEEYRLLSKREVHDLFPDCDIRTERFVGLPKSYVAIRSSRGPTGDS